jgi:hypothetical protein
VEGNQSIRRKPMALTCCKSLTEFITYLTIIYSAKKLPTAIAIDI